MTNLKKARHDLNILEKEYEPTFKDAVMAMRVLQKTINIRTQTEEDFDVSEDDIKHCHFAIECILEDINYDCYLEVTKSPGNVNLLIFSINKSV